jgi:hypothetical protein
MKTYGGVGDMAPCILNLDSTGPKDVDYLYLFDA